MCVCAGMGFEDKIKATETMLGHVGDYIHFIFLFPRRSIDCPRESSILQEYSTISPSGFIMQNSLFVFSSADSATFSVLTLPSPALILLLNSDNSCPLQDKLNDLYHPNGTLSIFNSVLSSIL